MDNKYHVLAVDDSLVDRMLIEKILKTNSFRVTAVDSVSKALRLLGLLENNEGGDNSTLHSAVGSREEEKEEDRHRRHHVNLIITDYSMPGLTGYDLLRKIKESEDLKDIPVVIMSSENIPARITRCLEEGAEEFLLKPVRLSDVDKLKPHFLKTACVTDMAMTS